MPNEMFGHEEILDLSPRKYTVSWISGEVSTIFKIPHKDFMNVFRSETSLKSLKTYISYTSKFFQDRKNRIHNTIKQENK